MHPLACRLPRFLLIAIAVSPLAARQALCDPPGGGGPDRKIAELRSRAEHGYVEQQVELAAAYLTGKGVSQDAAQAAHWYLKAAEAGDPGAQNQIGYFYQSGIGLPVDLKRAVHWFQLASASGMAWAKVNLGVNYLRGEGVRQNTSTARQLFSEAAEKGEGLGATYLGLMDYFGIGSAVDKVAAARWFETGAKLHDPQAAYDLAMLFCQSDDGGRDFRRSSELLRVSAGKGYVPAKHALGLLLVNHPELARSGEDPRRVLEEASNAGSWKSSLVLGVLERDGRDGRAANPGRALYYFHLASLQGGHEGERAVAPDVAALRTRLTPEEQATMAAEAAGWFREHSVALKFLPQSGERGGSFPMVAVTDPALGQ